MRLDKYLKVSRLIKRRTVAKDAALADLILVNDKVAKPATTLKVGDIITLHFGLKVLVVKVLQTEIPKRNTDEAMFELISEMKKS
ncbi:MAG: RNA-binding S4 domain-containing protein [Acholeplasma sp.]|jgi:ribosomal 50S subunit-recycling heat shock protein|nr:RNA-binding S4 domain-containing protein [Acholeplasma sp.]